LKKSDLRLVGFMQDSMAMTNLLRLYTNDSLILMKFTQDTK